MHTSARALFMILTKINRYEPDTIVANALAEVLGLSDDDDDLTLAVVKLRKLSLKVEQDIAKTDTADHDTRRAWQQFNQFRLLNTFGGVFNTIKTAKGSYLKTDLLAGLSEIDLFLEEAGIFYFEDKTNLKKLENEVSNLMDGLNEYELPNELKSFIYKRLKQIYSAISNYKFFGIEGLEDSVKELIGTIAMAPAPEDNQGAFKKLSKKISDIAKFTKDIRVIADNSGEAAELTTDTVDVIEKIVG